MPSIIEGYSYDIFISYRQKDNKYDGWVTEFVENINKELEATFKEEISVYFDINPHDGLLESHDVDESLKEKLKCLVFIPIISRTYCDPKSFAWDHEFIAFVEQAKQDHFGLKIKLPSSNVASRVLPIRIYDLNNADVKLCESVLGGILRGIEFIYAEPGVNRPLKPEDDEKINLNKTKYRNQINKVGNAIEEIISGLRTEPMESGKEKIQHRVPLEEGMNDERKDVLTKHARLPKKKLQFGAILIGIMVVAAILLYPKIFKRNLLENLKAEGKISVAVMPFQIMSTESNRDYWQNMVQDILINYLSNFREELIVRQAESITDLLQSRGITNNAVFTPSMASKVAKKLDADIVISGSIIQEDINLRLNAELINSNTKEVFKSFKIDGTSYRILNITDSLAVMVKDFFLISKMSEDLPASYSHYVSLTSSPEAYSHFRAGMDFCGKSDNISSVNSFQKAIEKDTDFVKAMEWISAVYKNMGLYEDAKEWIQKADKKIDKLSQSDKFWVKFRYAQLFGKPEESINYMRQLSELDDQMPGAYETIGTEYLTIYKYEEAITAYKKALEIYNKWDKKLPYWSYERFGTALHKAGRYKEEKKLYKIAEHDFPDNSSITSRQAILALTERDTIKANRYIEKYTSIRKKNSGTDASILSGIAWIYSEANILDEAEENYRKALSLEPDNHTRMIILAYFLIDKALKIEEGLHLVNNVIESSPDNYNYLHVKGWGLYKQGNYQEALEVLQNSWDLRIKNATYDHTAFLHLEAAKKAVESYK